MYHILLHQSSRVNQGTNPLPWQSWWSFHPQHPVSFCRNPSPEPVDDTIYVILVYTRCLMMMPNPMYNIYIWCDFSKTTTMEQHSSSLLGSTKCLQKLWSFPASMIIAYLSDLRASCMSHVCLFILGIVPYWFTTCMTAVASYIEKDWSLYIPLHSGLPTCYPLGKA